MKTSGFKCDHHQCHATSNGTLDGWYTVQIKEAIHVWPLKKLASMIDLEIDENRQHYCGISHALSAVRDAMEDQAGSATGTVTDTPEGTP